jgi:hypothetical protein
MTCASCEHYVDRAHPDATAKPKPSPIIVGRGICRRYPPRLMNDDEPLSWFPPVDRDQSCGEYARRGGGVPLC